MRLFVRPLIGLEVPIVKNLQIGATLVADSNPAYFGVPEKFGEEDTEYEDWIVSENDSVVISGIDFRLPLIQKDAFSMATFGDYVIQNNTSGGMLGFGGRIIKFLTYGAQLRILGEDFIPVYFDGSYDLYRPLKYLIYDGTVSISDSGFVGWFASTGFSILDDKIYFTASLDGPFKTPSSVEDPTFAYPHFLAMFVVAEGLIPGFFFDASYDKKNIQSFSGENGLFSAENATISARVNYKSGPATITLTYDLRYNPDAGDDEPWEVTSGLESSISLY
jgi:hypothetical protein